MPAVLPIVSGDLRAYNSFGQQALKIPQGLARKGFSLRYPLR